MERDWIKLHKITFIICNKKQNHINKASSTWDKLEINKIFWSETLNRRDILENLDVHGIIILKWISE